MAQATYCASEFAEMLNINLRNYEYSWSYYYSHIINLTLFDYLTILLLFYGPSCNILIISSVLQNKNNGTAI